MGNNILYKNKNLFYRTAGIGEAVVLLHGFGEDGNIWNNLAVELEKQFFVIIPDIPGSGNSEMLEGENISMEDFAETIKFILDKETINSCIIIGHSMGGYITLAFAQQYPDLLKAFGLFHSSAFADDEQKIETRLKGIEFIKKNGAVEFLKASIPGLFTDTFRNDHPDKIENLIAAGKKITSEALIQYYNAMMQRIDSTNVLKTFDKPILFIIGEKDKAIPLQLSLQQCHLPSTSHIFILPMAAHMGMMEENKTCNQIVLSFLTSNY